MFYREKLEKVEAIQFTRNNIEEVKQFTNGATHHFITPRCPNGKSCCLMNVANSVNMPMTVIEGDYIVKTEDNIFYIYQQSVFEKHYELMEEDNE